MLDLKDEDHPANRRPPETQLTRLQKDQGIIIVLGFFVWLPIYLIWVRGALNRVVFHYMDSYPAILHLFPLIGIPCLVALAFGRIGRSWTRYQ